MHKTRLKKVVGVGVGRLGHVFRGTGKLWLDIGVLVITCTSIAAKQDDFSYDHSFLFKL